MTTATVASPVPGHLGPARGARAPGPPRFGGFPLGTPAFLHALGNTRDRSWLGQHRGEYESLVLEPACGLVTALAGPLRRRVGRGLRVEPRVGGSILRPHRDARFAPDRPLKPHLELWFWEGAGPSRRHPGFFIRVEPERLTLGAGIRSFAGPQLLGYRQAVDDPQRGLDLAALLRRLERAGWGAGGRSLHRVPPPYSADHERAALLRHLGLWVETDALPLESIHEPSLPDVVVAAFRSLRPLPQ